MKLDYDDEIKKAETALGLITIAPTVMALNAFWEEFKDLAECKIDGVSIKTAVNNRKKELEA